ATQEPVRARVTRPKAAGKVRGPSSWRREEDGSPKGDKMRRNRLLALGAAFAVILAACSSGGGSSAAPESAAPSEAASVAPSAAPGEAPAGEAAKAPIKIGSDNFYESKLVAEIYAQALEHAGYTVDRKFGLGSRQERIPTMDAGQVDLVPEYVGSGLGFYDKTKITGDGQKNADPLQAALTAKGI